VPSKRALKPLITVYSGGSNSKTKRFDSVISAAFWAGVDYADEDINSVKIRQPSLSAESDLMGLIEFTSLLVQRQINFSVEFSPEPHPGGNSEPERIKSHSPVVAPTEDVELQNELAPFKKEKP
jgi:hypothetical protein